MEYIPSLVLTLVFCILLPWGVNVWISADTIITAIFGLTITFFPYRFLSRQTQVDLDDVHLHLYRMCGIMLLSSTAFAALARKSTDRNVTTGILWARVAGVSLYVIARVHGYMEATGENTGIWNEHALVFGIYGDSLWLLGNLIYALKMGIFGSHLTTKSDTGAFYMKSDFVQCMLFGLSFYIFPEVMIGFQTNINLESLHKTLIRMMSAFVFNTGIIAWRSCYFKCKTDKIYHLTSRILGICGLLTAQIYVQLTTESWTQWHVFFGMIGMSLWSINASAGYFKLKEGEPKAVKSKLQ